MRALLLEEIHLHATSRLKADDAAAVLARLRAMPQTIRLRVLS